MESKIQDVILYLRFVDGDGKRKWGTGVSIPQTIIDEVPSESSEYYFSQIGRVFYMAIKRSLEEGETNV